MKNITKKILTSVLLLFSLVSCGSRSISGDAEYGYEDNISIVSSKVDEVVNSKESGTSSKYVNSSILGSVDIKNNGSSLCSYVTIKFNVATKDGNRVYSQNYLKRAALKSYIYPGETKQLALNITNDEDDSYAFSITETYQFVDFTITSATYYKNATIYSTSDGSIQVSNISIKEIEGSDDKYNYRLDFSCSYTLEDEEKELSYPSCTVTIGDNTPIDVTSCGSIEYISNLSYAYLTLDEKLDLSTNPEIKIDLKAVATDEDNYDFDLSGIFIAFCIAIPSVIVLSILIFLVVFLICSKNTERKIKKGESKN